MEAVGATINSTTKSYRYVLLTQLVSKLAVPSLDSRCLQAQRGGAGAFDARSIASTVIVPFDQENESVLGGSDDPYVSNPLRVPELSPAYREKRGDKSGWDYLCRVVDAVEQRNDEQFTLLMFRQVLAEIYRRLATTRVAYPVPRRISLKKTLEVIESFLGEQSQGDRLLALSTALFAVIGRRFGLYENVRRGKITAADEPSGMLADLECFAKDSRIVIAAEVKDRYLNMRQLRSKLRAIREKRVSEIFFVTQGIVESQRAEISALIDREFTSGQNIYITDLTSLAEAVLSLLGEDGRRDFLQETANQLDTYKSEITHRRAWAALLEAI